MKNETKINKQEWNKFVLENKGSFLQSWEWGEFQISVGKQVRRFNSENRAVQFIVNKLPGVNKFYWYCPRGPVAVNRESLDAKSLEEIIEEAKKTAGKEAVFFRLGPEVLMDQAVVGQLRDSGFRQLFYDIEPSQTLILDITESEEGLLSRMHEKWRYNIRLAERKGVQVKTVNAQDGDFNKYFEEFYRLASEGTAERKGIKHHPKEYYKKQLEINSPRLSPEEGSENGSSPLEPAPHLMRGGVRGDFIRSYLFIAEYENKVIAANILVLFGGRATYLHGATGGQHREAMAPHLLQWEQIKYAKSQGCSEYDFWGIVNEHTLDKRGQSWEGFTRFKRGFGGREVNYVGYWDYPLDKKWYWLYGLVQKFRR